MAGTVEGGRAAAKKNKEKHGTDFYSRIGKKGGERGRTGGFFANRDLARKAGAMGGRKSRRTTEGNSRAAS
jgi:general stress protein YciG